MSVSLSRILGIDPGSRITGFGIIEWRQGVAYYLASGSVRTHGEEPAPRLREIFQGISAVIAQYQPTLVSVERVFVRHNIASAFKLGQARGVAICAAALADLPVHEYAPAQIKQAVVGRGNASKEQVQHMVRVLLNLPLAPPADAADALAAALCHTHMQQTLARLPAPATRATSWRAYQP